MKIAIIGTRGIPNNYGGFEQFAEKFSIFTANLGHDVTVYTSSAHPYKNDFYQGVKLVRCFDPSNHLGSFGQFIYDFFCIVNTRKGEYDIILQLGYTSSAIWGFLLPKNAVIITNMDGLEWQRSKYNKLTRLFLRFSEILVIKFSDKLIADSTEIQSDLRKRQGVNSYYISYGATPFSTPNFNLLESFRLEQFKYNILICRPEPENNVKLILDAVVKSLGSYLTIIIGDFSKNEFGRKLIRKYSQEDNIRFLGPIFNEEILNNLRYFSNLYFHGHSVGGTNPSLLEAIACKSLILAHRNPFNKAVLKSNGFYFSTSNELQELIRKIKKKDFNQKIDAAYLDIKENYNWKKINMEYLRLFNESI